MRHLVCAVLLFAAPLPLLAQGSSGVIHAADGFTIDFDDQDIRVVLSALAEAAQVNLTFTNLPPLKTTLHLAHPVPPVQLVDVITQIAESNGLTVTRGGSLIRIESRARSPMSFFRPPTPKLQLFTYRLKHTSAADLAPVIMSLVTGVTGQQVGGVAGVGGRTTGGTVVQSSNGTTILRSFPSQSRSAFTVTLPDATANGGTGAPTAAPPPQPQRPFGRGFQRAMAARAAAAAVGGDEEEAEDGVLSSSAADIRIVAEATTNSLLVRATPEDWEIIKKIVDSVDLRPLQVLIEVTIAEVQRNRDLDVGISGTTTHTKRGQTKPDATATMPSSASARDFVAELAGGHGTIDYNVALNALASRGELRVLSLPIIIAQNNKEATLNVGSSRPFVQISQAPGNDPNGRVETVNYIDVGTTLTITPTINVDGYVNLLVKQTANSATNEIQFDAPVISKREATTQVFVRNGQTTVIGGLADKSRERTRSGIPLLSDIPLLGFLFSNTEEHDVTNELYLFLTPHVISGDADVDRLRNAVKEGSILLKQVPITPLVPSDSAGPAPRDSVPAPRDSVPAHGDSVPDARHGGAPAMRPGGVRP